MEAKRWYAYVSSFFSLDNFYIHNKNEMKTFEEMSTNLQLLNNNFLTLDRIKPGSMVAAKYECDGLWYRAKVLNIEDNECNVLFIDYGQSQLAFQFKELPDKLARYHAFAYHCSLDDFDNEHNHKIKTNNEFYDLILKFLGSVEFEVTFLNNEEPYVVKMKWDNRNIKTFLNNLFSYGITHQTYEVLKQIDQNVTEMQVKIVKIESITEFYVETEDREQLLKKINDELENSTVWEPVTEFKIGKMVIAKGEADNRWYRVRIVEICENGNICYFIDYGTKDLCKEFYEVTGHDYLESAPPIIKRCSLHMQYKKNEFLPLSLSFVNEMEFHDAQKMLIKIVTPGEPCVVELFSNGLNMARIIEPKQVIVPDLSNCNMNAITVQINNHQRSTVLEELKDIKNLKTVKNPEINQIYGIKINEKWYRAMLKKIIEKKQMDVIVVDFGGHRTIVFKLFYLPTHLINVKYMYLHCTLNLDGRYFSNKKFLQLCEDFTKFDMIILKHDDIDGHRIHLTLNDEDVTEKIKRKTIKE